MACARCAALSPSELQALQRQQQQQQKHRKNKKKSSSNKQGSSSVASACLLNVISTENERAALDLLARTISKMLDQLPAEVKACDEQQGQHTFSAAAACYVAGQRQYLTAARSECHRLSGALGG